MRSLISSILVFLLSLMLSACSAASPKMDAYMMEMSGLANNLITIDAALAHGDWQEAGQDLEQIKVSLVAVATGFDGLEDEGIDSKQVQKGRAALTYLKKVSDVSGIMVLWHRKVAEVNPESLTKNGAIDKNVAVGSLNELITMAGDARDVLWDFLEYGQQYYSSDTDGARKLKAEITVPRSQLLYAQLDEQIVEFEGYLDILDKP